MSTHDTFEIRKAARSDARAIHDLITNSTERGKILKRSLSEIERVYRRFWVAEQDDRIVACCSLEIYCQKIAEVRSLAVHPEEERKGLASKLVEHCVAEAKKKKIYEVFVITNRDSIFRRFGFSEELHDQKALFLRP